MKINTSDFFSSFHIHADPTTKDDANTRTVPRARLEFGVQQASLRQILVRGDRRGQHQLQHNADEGVPENRGCGRRRAHMQDKYSQA
jgi:hypothetical protein